MGTALGPAGRDPPVNNAPAHACKAPVADREAKLFRLAAHKTRCGGKYIHYLDTVYFSPALLR